MKKIQLFFSKNLLKILGLIVFVGLVIILVVLSPSGKFIKGFSRFNIKSPEITPQSLEFVEITVSEKRSSFAFTTSNYSPSNGIPVIDELEFSISLTRNGVSIIKGVPNAIYKLKQSGVQLGQEESLDTNTNKVSFLWVSDVDALAGETVSGFNVYATPMTQETIEGIACIEDASDINVHGGKAGIIVKGDFPVCLPIIPEYNSPEYNLYIIK
jgi:hypothetical protein